MTGVRFDFEPHQWPPHALGGREGFADAVFTVEWGGKEVEVAARWVRVDRGCALLFFRAVDNTMPQLVVSRYDERISPRRFIADCMKEKSRVRFAEELTREAITSWSLSYGAAFRVPLQSADPQWLLLFHDDKRGAWIGQNSWRETPFLIDDINVFKSDVWQKPESSVGFALQWSQLSPVEQQKRAVNLAVENWDELTQLVQAVTRIDPAAANSTLRAMFYLSGKLHLGYQGVSVDWSVPPNARTRRWAFHIHRHYAPRLNENLAAQHICIARGYLDNLVCLSISSPTQHERLEAALFLRDWAQGKIPEREARLLLPKL